LLGVALQSHVIGTALVSIAPADVQSTVAIEANSGIHGLISDRVSDKRHADAHKTQAFRGKQTAISLMRSWDCALRAAISPPKLTQQDPPIPGYPRDRSLVSMKHVVGLFRAGSQISTHPYKEQK
jgi:hypothetical protein